MRLLVTAIEHVPEIVDIYRHRFSQLSLRDMRLAEVDQPVGLLQAGGLSSLALGVWLAEQGIATRHYIADLGQASRSDIDALADSLRRDDADVTVVDLLPQMARVGADLLRYQARHDGGYWNTTGASRFVLVDELAPALVADGCRTLAHGCVGGGNDQRRFERYTALLAPKLAVYSPWVNPATLARFPDRAAMLTAVVDHGLYLDRGSEVARSTDANIAGISHEFEQLEDLGTPVAGLAPRWSRWPRQAPADAQTVTVRFDGGRVVDVDGNGADPAVWLAYCNQVAGRHGVWLRDVVERRIIGTVCRGVYEAPGLELLDWAWRRILQASLDAAGWSLYNQLAQVAGAAMYEARWLDPAAVAARAAIDHLVADVSGRVDLEVHRGAVTVGGMTATSHVVRQTRFGSGGNRWSQPAA